MPTSAATQTKSRYSRIWKAAGIMGMSSDDVHDFVYRETQRDSLKDLTDKQVNFIGNLMWDMVNGRPRYQKPSKPSNEGGRIETQRQRARLYMEAMKIGWTPERVDGLVFHKFGISKQQWLNSYQCGVMIEIFKDKVRRAKKPYISPLLAALNNRIAQQTYPGEERA